MFVEVGGKVILLPLWAPGHQAPWQAPLSVSHLAGLTALLWSYFLFFNANNVFIDLRYLEQHIEP